METREQRYRWLFLLSDGSEITASFTNQEILELYKEYPEIKWPEDVIYDASESHREAH